MSELLKEISVRITATDKNNKSCVGSGSIINYKGQTYVITAEHCINGTKEERLADGIREIKIEIQKVNGAEFTDVVFKQIFLVEKTHDFAVLKIDLDTVIEEIVFVNTVTLNQKLKLIGYPFCTQPDFKELTGEVTVEPFKDNNHFKIRINEDFKGSSAESIVNLAKGISGSGLFLNGDTKYFMGILCEIPKRDGHFNEFICCKSEIIKQAIDDKLKEIEKKQDKENISKMKFENALNHFSNPSPIFTGRKKELQELKEAYNSFNIFAISGFGGIGKTEFINQFIYELDIANKKNQITWLDGNENSSFELFVKDAGFEVILKSNDTDQKKYAAFKDKINEHKRIVFLDNFQDIEKADPKFREFIEFANGKIENSKIFIISRVEPKFKNVQFKPIHLSGLAEAVELAKRIIENSYSTLNITDENISQICEYVANHPLAIELSLNLCNKRSFEKIIGQLLKYKTEAIEKLSERLFKDILDDESTKEVERKFIYEFSIFNEKVNEEVIEAILGEEVFYEAIPSLIDKNLLSFENSLYDTHPLIKEFCYDKLENKGQLHQKAADYFISKREEKLDVTIEKQIFYHLKGFTNIPEIENSLNKYGRILVRQAYYDFVISLVEYLTTKNINHPFHDLLLGNINKIKGNWNKALSFYETVEKNNTDKELALESLLEIGDIFQSKGDISKALDIYYQSLEIARANNFQKYVAWAYNGIATIKKFYGETDNALELHKKALTISQDLGEKEDISALYNNIGSIYSEKGYYDEALKYHKDSLKLSEEIGDKAGIANSYNNIGSIYSNKGNYDEALKYYEDSLKLSEEIGDKEGLAISHFNIGVLYYKTKEFGKSLLFHFISFIIHKQIHHIKLKKPKNAIGNIRNKLGLLQFRKIATQVIKDLEPVYRKEINIEEFLPTSPPVKSEKKYGSNTLVKVKFTDGRIAEYKYKHVEQKIENGDCEIIEE